MSQHQERFQALLRELFQFDSADLDFGIYRVMNHKREAIERYIADDLPQLIADDLSQDVLAEQALLAEQLGKAQEEIREVFGTKALDSDGELQAVFHETPLGARYLSLQAQQAGHVARGADVDAIQATIFNHLYGFFSRYYDDGDFISKRRYSRRERYAIPYNGEEVHLHWANKDQYYVKTGEHFRAYAFKARDISVRFEVVDANVEQNNVQGEKRYFIPRLQEVDWQEGERVLRVPFEFRPLSAAESAKNGNNHLQEALIAQAVAALPKHLDSVPLAAVTAQRHRDGDESVTLFEYHLRRYTRRNTTDFFIHKDLKGFLTRELDFYLKNEVLNIDGVETTDQVTAEGWARGWFQMLRLMKTAGGQVIDFLDQVESFQKMIWEKRKFVTDVQYLIGVRTIKPRFHAMIVENDAQWEEWQRQLRVDADDVSLLEAHDELAARRQSLLDAHPTLMIDTKYFNSDVVDSMLHSIGNIEDAVDGLVIHSDNFQALALLQQRYRDDVDAVYIDPPYNTFATKILYKNEYEHSSWLSLLESRMHLAHSLVSSKGITCTTIDDYEGARLALMMESTFGAMNRLATVAIRNNPSGRSTVRGFAVNHEYGIFYSKNGAGADVGRLAHTPAQRHRYSEVDSEGRAFEWENFRKSSSGSDRSDRPKQFFPLYCHKLSLALRLPRMAWRDDLQQWDVLEDPNADEDVILPLDSSDSEKVWRYGVERTRLSLDDMRVRKLGTRLEAYTRKYLQEGGSLPRTWWDKAEYSARDNGTRALVSLFGDDRGFEFPKAPAAVMDSIRICSPRDDGVVLDYFAGSGTTAHAVINLNRTDDRGVRFLLVEAGEHFDSILVPRIKKASFSPEWKDGVPVRNATEIEVERSPRIVKYMRLESYEDALNNVEFTDAGVQRAMELEDYVIKYMFQWETRDSATLLNIEQLSRPFDYQLATHANGNGGSARADVAETFNYLLGLRVRTRKVYYDEDRKYLVYRGTVDAREIVVIWRETAGWAPADYRRDQQFVIAEKIAEGADTVYVNGVSFLAGAKALEPLFKERMFAPLGP